MKTNKQKNLVMIAIAAVILVAVNVIILKAASNGAIAPIENFALWFVFVALNVASILWAVSLLGLQPLVIALSYIAGGFLAYMGVRGMEGISVAEVATAGAIYGAFGALAIGNVTAKVRLAFFKKGQVPFIFVIVGLLVIDAVLNSGISSSGGKVILNAVILPFILAGVVVGLIWSTLNRYGIGRKPAEVLAEAAEERQAENAETANAVASEKLVIQMPDNAAVAEEKPVVEKVKVAEPLAPAAAKGSPKTKKAKVQPVAPVAKAVVVPEVKEPVAVAPVEEKKPEEAFFPLEIDNADDFVLPKEDADIMKVVAMMDAEETEEEDTFPVTAFDASLYASGSIDESSDGGVMVEEPAVATVLETEVQTAVVEEAPAAPEPVQEAKAEEEKEGDSDWLGGHLDLLNKLK